MMRSVVITELTGGLGNQMFQYALGRALSLKSGAELLFDTRSLSRDTQRTYALGGFGIAGRIAASSELPVGWGPLTRRAPWLSRLLGGPSLVAERSFAYDNTIPTLTPPVALHGNWQSERYFAEIASTIRSDFSLTGPLDLRRQELAAEIGNTLAAISVHVRRGDYVSSPTANAYHGTCEPAWYAAAKARIDAMVTGCSYFVFSDDVAWAQANLPEFSGCRFVEPSADGRDECDIHLMSLCHHHIIANSSFSWWGAWLNPSTKKRVIAPARWFAGAAHDTRDLIPATWERL
jgi:hypothetical protein